MAKVVLLILHLSQTTVLAAELKGKRFGIVKGANLVTGRGCPRFIFQPSIVLTFPEDGNNS